MGKINIHQLLLRHQITNGHLLQLEQPQFKVLLSRGSHHHQHLRYMYILLSVDHDYQESNIQLHGYVYTSISGLFQVYACDCILGGVNKFIANIRDMAMMTKIPYICKCAAVYVLYKYRVCSIKYATFRTNIWFCTCVKLCRHICPGCCRWCCFFLEYVFAFFKSIGILCVEVAFQMGFSSAPHFPLALCSLSTKS